MKLNKCLLGEIITQRREKNTGENLPIRGVSREGLILPKQQDADTSIYNVFYRKDFVFNPARMELNSIAYNDQFDKAICSSLYEIFYVSREDVILPEFLKLIIKQDWFTRYCEFLGSGSAREYCRFANICEIEIEFPELEVQKKIVRQYKIVEDRIQILKKINDNLEATAQAVFEDYFAEYYAGALPLPNGWKKAILLDVCQIRGGKRLPAECEFANDITSHPYIRIRDMYQGKYLELTEDFEYIGEDVFAYIRNYTVASGDVIIAIVGITSGEIAIIGETLDGANLTENCVKLTNYNGITAEYLYCYWQYLRKNGNIDPLLVGAAQPKLPIYNIQSVPVIIPDDAMMDNYQNRAAVLAKGILNNIQEIKSLREMQQLIISRLSSR